MSVLCWFGVYKFDSLICYQNQSLVLEVYSADDDREAIALVQGKDIGRYAHFTRNEETKFDLISHCITQPRAPLEGLRHTNLVSATGPVVRHLLQVACVAGSDGSSLVAGLTGSSAQAGMLC